MFSLKDKPTLYILTIVADNIDSYLYKKNSSFVKEWDKYIKYDGKYNELSVLNHLDNLVATYGKEAVEELMVIRKVA